MVQLSTGSIAQIHADVAMEAPVLQLLSIKKLPGNAAGGIDRYRRVLRLAARARLSGTQAHLLGWRDVHASNAFHLAE
jgi:hypothetical protein